MALLPDLAAAALYAAVVFLMALGILVVFVETVPTRLTIAIFVGSLLAAGGLVWTNETGVALLVLGVGVAFVANHAFEWLTTR